MAGTDSLGCLGEEGRDGRGLNGGVLRVLVLHLAMLRSAHRDVQQSLSARAGLADRVHPPRTVPVSQLRHTGRAGTLLAHAVRGAYGDARPHPTGTDW